MALVTYCIALPFLCLSYNLFTIGHELTRLASFAFAALFQIIRTATSGGMA
jgi:hypothetical protein